MKKPLRIITILVAVAIAFYAAGYVGLLFERFHDNLLISTTAFWVTFLGCISGIVKFFTDLLS